MSADLLRKAAREMREKAKAAIAEDNVGERWVARPMLDPDNNGWAVDMYPEVDGFDSLLLKTPYDYEGSLATHIASWHPAVALAVADQLDDMADVLDGAAGTPLELAMTAISNRSVAVARVYLGTDA